MSTQNQNREIYKTNQSNLYPQIYKFVCWKGNKNFTIKIQGLQNVQCRMIHSNIDGSIEIHVLDTYTLDFNFSSRNPENWITAEVKLKVDA